MLKIYKVPGVFVACFVGKFGTGKTLSLIENALYTADAFELNIVANFQLNPAAMYAFAIRKKLKSFLAGSLDYFQYKDKLISKISIISMPGAQLLDLLQVQRSVILFDEAGVGLFARAFSDKKRTEILVKLFQIRKRRNILFYSCQNQDQIDKQLRDMTDIYIQCSASQKFSRQHKRSNLISRFQVLFDSSKWEQYNSSVARFKLVRPFLLSGFKFSFSHLAFGKLIAHFRSFKFALYTDIKNNIYIRSMFLPPLNDEDLLFRCYSSLDLIFDSQQKSTANSTDFIENNNGHNRNSDFVLDQSQIDYL